MPTRGEWILRCDCGWEGRTPQLADLRHRSRVETDEALNEAFLAHLRPDERRTYLLVDSRRPEDFMEVDEIIAAAACARGEQLTRAEAQRRYAEQPPIVGVFVMPESIPAMLVDTRESDDPRYEHLGTYRIGNEPPAELPIGEVRTPEGRVFRVDE